MEVKWCGFDYGQCIMEPGGLRTPLLIGEIYKELGRPELIPDKIRKHRVLKEKYRSYPLVKEGTLYDVLAQELRERGIEPHEAVMVGDKPETDIDPAHDRGFKTIKYTGFIDLGESKADITIHSFEELKPILKKKD